MLNTEKDQQKSPAKRFLFILGLVMFVFYLVLGLAVIFWKEMPLNVGKDYKNVFGLFLIIYALFRLVRIIQSRREL